MFYRFLSSHFAGDKPHVIITGKLYARGHVHLYTSRVRAFEPNGGKQKNLATVGKIRFHKSNNTTDSRQREKWDETCGLFRSFRSFMFGCRGCFF